MVHTCIYPVSSSKKGSGLSTAAVTWAEKLSLISAPNGPCQRKSPRLGRLSTELVGGVQDSAPQRQQLYVRNSRHPHFARESTGENAHSNS